MHKLFFAGCYPVDKKNDSQHGISAKSGSIPEYLLTTSFFSIEKDTRFRANW
jgi:hypothetical protein